MLTFILGTTYAQDKAQAGMSIIRQRRAYTI